MQLFSGSCGASSLFFFFVCVCYCCFSSLLGTESIGTWFLLTSFVCFYVLISFSLNVKLCPSSFFSLVFSSFWV